MNSFKPLIYRLFPAHCVLCHKATYRPIALCKKCEHTLPKLISYCQHCSVSLPISNHICHECFIKPPYFNQVIAPFHYEHPLKAMISAFKFQNQLAYAPLLAYLMYQHIQNHYTKQSIAFPEVLIPVPLHDKRLRKRGFNQSILLAKQISKAFTPSIRVMINAIKRQRNTTSQTGLTKQQRHKNLKDAFQLVQPLPFHHIAIIDDVMTTGSTANEISRLLAQTASIKRIDVWCCARA